MKKTNEQDYIRRADEALRSILFRLNDFETNHPDKYTKWLQENKRKIKQLEFLTEMNI